MPILRVALDVPLNKLFDYRAPDKDVTAHDVGLRVRVPFGKRVVTGVIMEVGGHSSIHPEKLKSASLIFRDVEPLPKNLLDLFRFCAAYYHHPLGQVVMNGLPTRLRSGKPLLQKPDIAHRYRLTATGRDMDVSAIPARNIVRRRLLATLKEKISITMQEAKQFSSKGPATLSEFEALRWVEGVPTPVLIP